ncbi:hypothetical protein [Nonomuraea sp. NPDC049158]|uniref:hypothetical protein n=1 Tax=Nonomuraea sp. NPDC049158 TaxID=3155649 RepID=UPI003402F9A5
MRARPESEGPYTAVRNALFDLASTRGAGVAVLFSGLPGQMVSEPSKSAQPVLLELEDCLMDALRDRLVKAGSGEDEPTLALRASVLSRANVGALRATVLAFHALPEEERTLDSARRLARQAFDILGA